MAKPTKSTEDLFTAIYTDCGLINWSADQIKATADQIKQAQVRIELNARQIQNGVIEPPPVDPPPIDPPPEEITPPPESGSGGDPTQQPRIGPANLQYLGAFKLPEGVAPGCAYGFDYALTGIAYHSQNHSLFINNHAYEQKTAEVTIPTPSLDMAHLPRATYLQHPVDIAEGRLQNVLAGGGAYWDRCEMGDLLVVGDKLVGTSYIFYDGAKQGVLSHFYSNKLVSQTGDTVGMFDVWDGGRPGEAGFVAGWMCHVPPEWQALLGGPCLTGQGCLSIISRTSFGPAAFVFDPRHLPDAGSSTVVATPLVYYDEAHQTLGEWGQEHTANLYFNQATQIRGIAFPSGSRSVLFFGLQGLGIPCYGESDLTAPKPPGQEYNGHCYDPARPDKGCHAYPYQAWVWAYDANDFVKVKRGELQPWDVRPYEVWGLDFPHPSPTGALQGAAYDPLHQRVYVSQYNAEYLYPGANPYYKIPIIHVYQLRAAKGGLLHV